MSRILTATLLLAALALPALAQTSAPANSPPPTTGTPAAPTARTPTPAQAAQQQRMRDCNATAGSRSLTGDARRSFMSECLAGRGN